MKNKTFGSALIVAGTTIGAGMLAMPITSAGMGFTMTLCLLIALWLLLTYSALLFVEVYQTAKVNDGIASLAGLYFGPIGRIITTIVLLVFMYAILTAYITGGGSLLGGAFDALGHNGAMVLFTVVLGIFIIIGTSTVDVVNRMIFLVKLIAFAVVLFLMLQIVKVDNLTFMPTNNLLFLSAAPVFFTSFGFHVVIPSVVEYLDGDTKKIKNSIILGTTIPLVAYILWQLSTHGVLSQPQFIALLDKNPSLAGLVAATKEITQSSTIEFAMNTFGSLALVTSFLGVSLGLVDGLKDFLNKSNASSVANSRIIIALLTFAPPLFFALFYQNFLAALGYAGIMFAFYGLVLPVAMAFRARKLHPEALKYRVAGGSFALVFSLILGILIMLIPFAIEAGLLPAVVAA